MINQRRMTNTAMPTPLVIQLVSITLSSSLLMRNQMATDTAMGMIKLKLILMAIEAKRTRATAAAMVNMDFSPFLSSFYQHHML